MASNAHKFKIGQSVDFQPSRQSLPANAQAYKVVRLLPSEGGINLYRVKCAREPFERMAKESELTLAA